VSPTPEFNRRRKQMPWLTYEVDEVDPVEMAEWEATDPEEKGPAPEPQTVSKTVEIAGEARLTVSPVGGSFLNLAVGPGGVTSIAVSDEDPNAEPPVKSAKTEPKSSSS
jgi:hypothetical protein